MINPYDRALGMDRDMTRRDFLNGVAVALTGSLVARRGSPRRAPRRRRRRTHQGTTRLR